MSFIPREQLKTEAERLYNELKPKAAELTARDRRAIPQQEMPSQAPEERVKNMQEVTYGYSKEQAVVEALRCLQCKKALCIEGCPVRIDIPAFIKAIVDEDFKKSIDIIKRDSLLPAICGRVCPQETQCQEKCTLGAALKDKNKSVSIGRLERYVADWERENNLVTSPDVKPETGKSVAVIGSGPASITVAGDVRREGHRVVMFEAFHRPGGVIVYGIPEFRMPKAIVDAEIKALQAMGVEVKTNFLVGRTRKLKDLMDKDGFDAVFIGTGAGLPRFMHIEGENLVGVFSANEYLTRANLMKAYDAGRADTPIFKSRKVAVLGGGNVAMDSARMAKRIGAQKVSIVYRRSEVELPARIEEVHHAMEEGIEFRLLTNAQRVLGDEKGLVQAIETLSYELGEPDESGRRRPVPIKGSEQILEVDTVIVAIGNDSNPLIKQTTDGLETNKWGNVIVDENCKTSLDRVYAGGDIALGSATVILAMGQGRTAAKAINQLLAGS
ncbi:MAG: NADPH-dependent glutamate synthase [Spirochaetales bacterium]|nr:NADPH-dependent glutamate synthase [Spirochaetales bacterium]